MSARWAPVRIEPIPCSGELLTIAIAVQGENDVKVVSALPEDVIDAVFGVQGASLLGLARSTTDNLYQHLRSGAALGDWRSPLDGVFLGGIEEGEGDDLRQIAEQALRASACLSAMTEAFQNKNPREERNTLLTRVARAMKKIDRDLVDFFKKDVDVVIRNTPISIACDYFSSRLAINMSALAPGARLGQQFEAFNARLCRLDQLKAHEALVKDGQVPKIILAVPSQEDLELNASTAHRRAFHDKHLLAQDLADSRKLELILVNSPEQGAQRIQQDERSAAA